MARSSQQQPQQRLQAVRLLDTNETKQVPIHTNFLRPWERVVHWNDIKEQFPNVKVAISAETGLDFQRDSNGEMYVPPLS